MKSNTDASEYHTDAIDIDFPDGKFLDSSTTLKSSIKPNKELTHFSEEQLTLQEHIRKRKREEHIHGLEYELELARRANVRESRLLKHQREQGRDHEQPKPDAFTMSGKLMPDFLRMLILKIKTIAELKDAGTCEQ